MKYRSRVEIASKILRVAVGGRATKTRLMYGSFLSFTQINEYLRFLTSNTLIMTDPNSRVYTLTEKGVRFLNLYDEMTKLVPQAAEVPAALIALLSPVPVVSMNKS
jgi:predicted transcriptional regulator